MNILKKSDVTKLQKVFNYDFKDVNLLDNAFTHSSTANLYGYQSNEKLEFFGDSILSFIISEMLYLDNCENEGELSKLRANIVSAKNLAKIVDEMNIFSFYEANEQIKKMNVLTNIKADLFESILGAIYLDGGLDKAKTFVKKFVDLKDLVNLTLDDKTMLQEFLQSKGITNFKYNLLSQSGPAHQPVFEVELVVEHKQLATATGKSKRLAEQSCAKKAMKNYFNKNK